MLVMQQSIKPDDISDGPLTFYPGEIQSQKKFVFKFGRGRYRRTIVFGYFDRREVLEELSKGNNEVTIAGRLTTGQCFYGNDTVWLVNRHWWW